MPDTVTLNVKAADMPQVARLIDAVADLFADPYEAGLHDGCAHDPCTYRQLRMRAEEFSA